MTWWPAWVRRWFGAGREDPTKAEDAWTRQLWNGPAPACRPPVVTLVGHAFGASKNGRIKSTLLRDGMIGIILSTRYLHNRRKLQWAMNVSIETHGAVLPAYVAPTRAVRALRHDARILSPPVDVVEMFENKVNASEWMRRNGGCGFAVPRQYRAPWHVRSYPVMKKPYHGISGRGVEVVHNATLLQPGWFFEEAVQNDTEWSVQFSALNGTLVAERCLRLRFAQSLFVRRHKGTVGTLKSITSAECAPSTRVPLRRLMRRTGYHGLGCLGVKYRGETPFFIELNARLCGMAVSHHGGAILKDLLVPTLARLDGGNVTRTCRTGAEI